MAKQTKVQCDNCPAIFTLEDNTKRSREHGVESVQFQCPECGKLFPAYKTNREIRVLQGKVAEERKRVEVKVARGMEPKEAEKKLQRLQKELKHKMNIFNQRKEPSQN